MARTGRNRRLVRYLFRRRDFQPVAERFHGLGYFAGRVHRWGSGTPKGNRAYMAIRNRYRSIY